MVIMIMMKVMMVMWIDGHDEMMVMIEVVMMIR